MHRPDLPKSGQACPRVYVVRVNGGEESLKPLESRLVESLKPLESRLVEKGYDVQGIPQHQLLQEEGPFRSQAVSVIYPYKQTPSTLDQQRFLAFARKYRAITIFIVGETSTLNSAFKDLPADGNVRKVFAHDLADRPRTIDEIVETIETAHVRTMPKGVVAIYDPKGLLRPLRSQLRDGRFWAERFTTPRACVRDIEYNKGILDAIIVDYANPEDANLVIRRARDINHAIPIIALVDQALMRSYTHAQAKATHVVLKSQHGVPWAQVRTYLGQAVAERRAQASAAKPDTVYPRVDERKPSRVFLIMGAATTGKTSVTDLVTDLLGPDEVVFIKKYSTRMPRRSERDGADFLYMSNEQFEMLKSTQTFLYDFEINGNKYGVPRAHTMDALRERKHALMVCRDFKQLAAFEGLFPNNMTPIMLFADYETLEDRLRERKSTASERKERLANLKAEDQLYADNYSRFPYRFYTDRGVTVLDTARRVSAAIRWGSSQSSPRTFEATHSQYVDHVVKLIVGVSAGDLVSDPSNAKLQLDAEEIREYARTNYVSGASALINRLLPISVSAVSQAYGHLGIFLDGHGNEAARCTMLARTILLDIIDQRLRKSGLFVKTRSRTSMPEDFSRFAFVTNYEPALIDGLLYALTDEYILRPQQETPHAVSIGFIDPRKNSLRPAALEQFERPFLLDTRRGNNPYDNEIKRAVLKAYRGLAAPPHP